MNKLKWGVLSTAKIGLEKVLPAMQKAGNCEIVAIASRNPEHASAAAKKLNIPIAYGSYEELLADKNIDAVYNPLPNHMHVPWTIKAMQAGKHVLCEKPIALTANEAGELLDATKKFPQLKLMEAFMYRHHPQWKFVKQKMAEGGIGTLRNIHSIFSYYNIDPNNIRNQKEIGGGGLMDIGCYCISISRWLFEKEPVRVLGWMDHDPEMGTDRLSSGILDFETGTSLFTCSTQMVPFQRLHIMGTLASIELEIPFNAPADKPTKAWIYTKSGKEEISFDAVDQYTLQGEVFAEAVLENKPLPVNIVDAINNMKVIEAIEKSAAAQSWHSLGK